MAKQGETLTTAREKEEAPARQMRFARNCLRDSQVIAEVYRVIRDCCCVLRVISGTSKSAPGFRQFATGGVTRETSGSR